MRRIPDIRILVVGDVMVDHFIWGKVDRISPEAPVPVVQVASESKMPGGSANVAHNLISLGAEVGLVGITGQDSNSKELIHLLRQKKIYTHGILSLPDRITTKKTRIIAHSQQVVRVDWEQPQDLDVKTENLVIKHLRKLIPLHDAVVLEDYGKGLMTQAVLDEAVRLCRQKGIFCSFDPKIGHDLNFKGVSLCTPNLQEASYLAKTHGIGAMPENGGQLREALGVDHLLVTLGEKGMGLFSRDFSPYQIQAAAREVYDVSGAGDTVISVFTASAVAGAKPFEAAFLSNIAAGIVVGKLGTAVVTIPEIEASLSIPK